MNVATRRALRRFRYNINPHPNLRQWAQQAACIDYPPEWWFPNTAKPSDDNLQALNVCNNICPVKTECGEYAAKFPEMWNRKSGLSIWAGQTIGGTQ